MAHTFTKLLVHATFGTKDRRPVLDKELRPRVFAYMGGIVRELGGKALAVNGSEDHVHLALRLPPTACLSDVMRLIKANSSRWANENRLARGLFGWQTGYGAFSVSESQRGAIEEYIARQPDHHRKVDFRAEFVALLRKHGIAFDEALLWK